MKPRTFVRFLTLGLLLSTDAFASILPPATPHDVIHQREDTSDSVILLEEESPRTMRRSRFRKRASSLPVESEAHTIGGFEHGEGNLIFRDSDDSSASYANYGNSFVGALQGPDNVRKREANIVARATFANPTDQVDILAVSDGPDEILVSARNPYFVATNQDNESRAGSSVMEYATRHRGSEERTSPQTKRDDDEDLSDIKYLNYALVMEQLLYEYYLHGLRRFSEDDFTNAGFQDWVRGRFKEMAEHERTHKEFLESAIVAAGCDHVQPGDYDFQDQDVYSFIDTSMALESIAASAYIGILQFFNNKAYVTAEAAMLADRARQAAWINSAVRKQNPWNTAFETPLTPQQVLTLLSVFENDETSPKLNKKLLPDGLQPFPRLTLSPRLVPGEQAEISFPYSEPTDGKQSFVFAAFMSGVEIIFGRVLDREEPSDDGGQGTKRYFVEIPRDLASRGVVYVMVLKGDSDDVADVRMDDDSVVAGPAIAMFPFDAEGKAI